MKSPIIGFFVILIAFLTIGCARSQAKAADGPQTTPSPAFAATVTTTNAVTIIPTSTPSATAAATATPTLTPTANPTLTPTATPTPVFGGYFKAITLGKLPPGPKAEKWWNTIISATAFEAEEDLCAIFNIEKDSENVSYGIYGTDSQIYAKTKTLISENGKLRRGSSTSCFGKIRFPKDKYEFRIWVGDNLIAALKFEVKSEPATPTPQPTATRIPQPIISPPTPPAPAGPLKIPATGFALPVSSMNQEAEVPPGIADQVKIIFAYRIQTEKPHVIVSMRVYNLLRQNISEITIQECLTNENYSFCHNPRKNSVPAGDPPRAIYYDTNSAPYLSDEDLKKYDLDWQVKIKVLNIIISTSK